MSKRRRKGPCFTCGASLYLGNCNPPSDPCECCGQCSCLARDIDGEPE